MRQISFHARWWLVFQGPDRRIVTNHTRIPLQSRTHPEQFGGPGAAERTIGIFSYIVHAGPTNAWGFPGFPVCRARRPPPKFSRFLV